MDRFEAEVRKVLSATYSVSLKQLHNTLNDFEQKDYDALRAWAFANRKDVSALGTVVVEGLVLWPYCLLILQTLSAVRAFRDVVLQKHPEVLENVLAKAINSADSYTQFAGLSMTLLADPLPSTVPLPASAQTFLSQIIEFAAENPTTDTLEPVYNLLDGACEGLLDILPQSFFVGLSAHLTKTLRNLKGVENQMLSLLCLAIMAKLSRSSIAASEGNQPQPHALRRSQRPTHPDVEKFFSGERASKTIHLVALQVIYACRPDSCEPAGHIFKHLKLANDIVAAILPCDRNKWAGQNAQVLRKLQERVVQPILPASIRLEALSFSTMLIEDDQFHSRAAKMFHESFLSLDFFAIDEMRVKHVFSTTLPKLAPFFESKFWKELILKMVETLQSEQQSILQHVFRRCELSDKFIYVLSQSPYARKQLADVVVTGEIHEKLHLCLSHSIEHRRRFDNEIVKFLVGAMVLALADGHRVDTWIILEFIKELGSMNVQTELSRGVAERVSLPMALDMAEVSAAEFYGASRKWRDKLAAELRLDARHREDTIVKLVAEICSDFEERCNTVEEPLKQEQAKIQSLRDENAELQIRIEELNKQLENQTMRYTELESDKTQLESDTNAAYSRIGEMKQRHQDTMMQLQQEKEQALDETSKLRRDIEGQKLELQTVIACEIEKVDDGLTEIATLTRQLRERDEALEKFRESASSHQTELKSIVQDLQSKVDSSKLSLDQMANEVERGRQNEQSLQESLLALQEDLQKANVTVEESISTIRADREAYELKLNTVCRQYEESIEHARIQTSLNSEDLKNQFKEKESLLNHALEQISSDIHEKEGELQTLHRKLDEYVVACQEKDQKLNEAHTMRENLLSIIGAGGRAPSLPEKPVQTPASRRKKEREESASREVREQTRQLDDDQYGTPLTDVQMPLPKTASLKDKPSPTTPRSKLRNKTRSAVMSEPLEHKDVHSKTRNNLGIPRKASSLYEASSSALNSKLDPIQDYYASRSAGLPSSGCFSGSHMAQDENATVFNLESNLVGGMLGDVDLPHHLAYVGLPEDASSMATDDFSGTTVEL